MYLHKVIGGSFKKPFIYFFWQEYGYKVLGYDKYE